MITAFAAMLPKAIAGRINLKTTKTMHESATLAHHGRELIDLTKIHLFGPLNVFPTIKKWYVAPISLTQFERPFEVLIWWYRSLCPKVLF